jgi:hypothetical protein
MRRSRHGRAAMAAASTSPWAGFPGAPPALFPLVLASLLRHDAHWLFFLSLPHRSSRFTILPPCSVPLVPLSAWPRLLGQSWGKPRPPTSARRPPDAPTPKLAAGDHPSRLESASSPERRRRVTAAVARLLLAILRLSSVAHECGRARWCSRCSPPPPPATH